MTTPNKNAPISAPPRRLNWNDPGVRAVVYQVIALAAVALAVWFLVSNTLHNLSVRNIATGFGFLQREAGFAIGETPIAYTPADTYGRAIWVGLLNTLRVAVLGIVLATILGTLIGVGRLSKNWLVAKITSVYVEVMRNVPLLLQLFFWYALITENMPGPRQAHNPLPGVFISNRGLKVPALEGNSLDWMLAGLGLAIVAILFLGHWGKKRSEVDQRVVCAVDTEHRVRRIESARRAGTVLARAAELAPVLGLVGTLVSLGGLSTAVAEDGDYARAIAMAVATTLYGLVAANFVFAPLAAVVTRRAEQEDSAREDIIAWLLAAVEASCQRPPEPARNAA